jgi:ribosome assembly protein 1
LPALIDASPGAEHVDGTIRNAMVAFSASETDPIVAYVSKMVAVRASELPQNKRKGGGILTGEEARDLARQKRAEIEKQRAALEGETAKEPNDVTEALSETNLGKIGDLDTEQEEDPEHLIGFARLCSGTLSVGDSIYVLPPKFSPANPHAPPEPQRVTVTGLYLLMGRGLESLGSVPAGCVFGIAGLAGHILKSGTLCSQLEGSVNLAGINMGSQPIVRVALEPVNPGDLDKMIIGMRLLEQSDPCAQYEVLESGEHVILTAGELHLERCLKDLRERFAKCDIQAGKPIVPYRESIVNAAEMAAPREKDLPRGTVISVTTSKHITMRLRVRPLPTTVVDFLEKHAELLRRLYSRQEAEAEGRLTQGIIDDGEDETEDADVAMDSDGDMLSMVDFKNEMNSLFVEDKGQSDVWAGVAEKVAAFGPRRVGPNILIDNTKQDVCQRL